MTIYDEAVDYLAERVPAARNWRDLIRALDEHAAKSRAKSRD